MAFRDKLFKSSPFLILIFCICVGFFRQKCYKLHSDFQIYLGTKAPYRIVANYDTQPFIYQGCTPEKIWSIIRHGTRTPKTKTIISMKNRLSVLRDAIVYSSYSGKGYLCPEVIESFKNWSLQVPDSNSQYLTEEGELEMLTLGRRMQTRFPDIINAGYSNNTFKFRYTANQRTEISAIKFADGLFGDQVGKQVWYPEAIDKDPILRFYKICDKWLKTVKRGQDTYKERLEFLNSSHVNNTIENVSQRLGLGFLLNFDDIFLMYETCGYETAWSNETMSPWCVAFSKADMEVVEYFNDLKYYWRDGYGFPLNYEQSCPAINDMLNHFLSDSSEVKAVFYFTHSGTLLKIMCFLNLYKDSEILKGTNFDQLSNRLWKVSKIDTFGTNLQFIKYKCADNDSILTLHQERPVRLNGCPAEHDLCPLETFLTVFDKGVTCNFNDICSTDK